MKSNAKTKIIIITLGVVLTFLSISTYNIIDNQGNNDRTIEIRDKTNLKNLKKSGYWTTNFIHIDGNWSHTTGNYTWCSGDGSWSNPYTIENITIDASGSPTGSGIYIENSKNDYFIIRNCTVYNAGINLIDAGIKLENTNNGILINNNCSYNGRRGISLSRCNNNTISLNIVCNNGADGISIWGIPERYCYGNKILKNTASYNRFNGLDLWYCYNNNVSKNHLSYNRDNGIYLNRATDSTIIRNNASYNRENGIDLDLSERNLVSENNVNFNVDDGIHLNSDNNIILKNIANHNYFHGIHLIYCENNILEENLMYKCGLGIFGTYSSIVSLSTNDVDTTNKINDKPIYYYTSMSGLNSDDFLNAGQVILIGCSSSIVSDLNVSFGSCGIFLYKCNNIKVSKIDASFNTQNGIYSYDCKYLNIIQNKVDYNDKGIYYHPFPNGNGIHLRDCNYCNILENNVNNNSYGIWIYHGNNTVVSENIVEDNDDKGIYINYCFESSVSGNILNNNTNGIQISEGYGNDIIMNTMLNCYNGIYLRYTDYNTVSGNTVNNNNIGIILSISNYNTVSRNTANNNGEYGIYLDESSNGNNIYLNCFNNTLNAYDDGSNNHWDNGIKGNYWADYTGLDENDDGIGDVPYDIPGSAGSQDNFPLMKCPILSKKGGVTIPGYNLFFLLGILSVVSIIISKKLKVFSANLKR